MPRRVRLLFEVVDPEGRRVGLTRNTWHGHIQPNHPEVALDWVRDVIEHPDFIFENSRHRSINYIVSIDFLRYRLVSAKPRAGSNPPYLVATAYPSAIPPQGHGRIIWRRP